MTELGVLDRLVGAMAWTLVHSLWQGFLVATGLAVALAGLRGKSARSRYGVACAALLVMALLPAATVLHQLSIGLSAAEQPRFAVTNEDDRGDWIRVVVRRHRQAVRPRDRDGDDVASLRTRQVAVSHQDVPRLTVFPGDRHRRRRGFREPVRDRCFIP